MLTARRLERLERLASHLGSPGISVTVERLDVRHRKAVERFSQEQSLLLSRLDVLINNAGLAKGFDPIQQGNVEDWEQMWETNVNGLLYVTRAVLPHFLKRQAGHVVHLGSVAGRWVYPRSNVYCATKRAVTALTEAMRLDLNGTGIRVTEISPGMVETEFSLVRLGDSDKAKAVYADTIPLSAADVAEAILWCVSRPRHVNVQEMVLYSTDQASTTLVHRRA